MKKDLIILARKKGADIDTLNVRKIGEFLENQGFIVETQWEMNIPLTLKEMLNRVNGHGPN